MSAASAPAKPGRAVSEDPIAVLQDVATMARDAIRALAEGRAANGRAALGKIERRAADGVRWIKEDARMAELAAAVACDAYDVDAQLVADAIVERLQRGRTRVGA